MIDFTKEFEKMAPYSDHQVEEVMKRVLDAPEMEHVAKFLFPDEDFEMLKSKWRNVKSIHDFQMAFSYHAVKSILNNTGNGFTVSGLGNLCRDKAHLFLANHRDIALDSAFLQEVLADNNARTSQITFGSNLMSSQFIIDIGKLNKMFTFYRDDSRIQKYRNAMLHSAYIKKTITGDNESIWIAQRDGRTKDGNDKTQIALLKMLFGTKDVIKEEIKALNILPVIISYEYEPCDAQKIWEMYQRRSGEYIKAKDEDFLSVINGITKKKGRIHLAFGKPVNQFIDRYENTDVFSNEIINEIVDFVDDEVYENYKLWPGNYVAYSKLTGDTRFIDKFTSNDEERFEHYAQKSIESLVGDISVFKKMFYKLYAYPVANKHKIGLEEKGI